jgi:hypothetical protein
MFALALLFAFEINNFRHPTKNISHHFAQPHLMVDFFPLVSFQDIITTT